MYFSLLKYDTYTPMFWMCVQMWRRWYWQDNGDDKTVSR